MSELLGIESQAIQSGIMSLDEMDAFVASHESTRLFNIVPSAGHKAIKDMELKRIDELIDNGIINKLLSYKRYSPSMREIFPSTFLRSELLKAIKHPEVSYRKFCGDDKTYARHKETSPYIGMESKQNRAFVGLPLNRKQMISHDQMCQFRNSLSFVKQVNLSVYVLSLVRKSGFLGDDLLHCVDSSELAVDRQLIGSFCWLK